MKKYATVLIILAVCAVCLAIRLPAYDTPLCSDSGVFGYVTQRLLSGDMLYRDIADHKPPMIYIMGLLWTKLTGDIDTAFWWMELTFVFATLALVWLWISKGTGLMAQTLTMFIFLFCYQVSFFYYPVPGHITHLSTFFTALAYFSYSQRDRRDLTALLAGGAVCASVLSQPLSLLAILPLWLWLFLERRWLFIVLHVLTMAIAASAMIVYLLSKGILDDLWFWVVSVNRSYASLKLPLPGAYRYRAVVYLTPMIIGVVLLWNYRRSEYPRERHLYFLWLLGAIASIIPTGPRMYAHYFVPISVPLALCIGLMFKEPRRIFSNPLRIATGVIALLFFIILLKEPVKKYRGTIRAYATKQHERMEIFFDAFPDLLTNSCQTVLFFVQGSTEPSTWALQTGTKLPGKLTLYYSFPFDGKQEVAKEWQNAIMTENPRYIFIRHHKRSYSWISHDLKKWIFKNYAVSKEIEDDIYMVRNSKHISPPI